MNIVRFYNQDTNPVLGVLDGDLVYEISSLDPDFRDWQTLTTKAKKMGLSIQTRITASEYRSRAISYVYEDLQLLTPVEAPEVWAAGVTYERSRRARNEESHHIEAIEKSIYDLVYEAERPELFLKSTAARTIAPGEPLSIRSDSNWQIPEPEVGLVLDSDGEILGYTAGNDLSSRDIEGENPLYLPQAKLWRGSCSFGPSIRLAETVPDPYNLQIGCRIYRDQAEVFCGQASTSQLKRTFDELVHYLGRDNIIFAGTVLLTGTCIVPDESFTLQSGDRVEIEVEGVGVLKNTIR